MAQIHTLAPAPGKIAELSEYLARLSDWQRLHEPPDRDDGLLAQLWYRGVNEEFAVQTPGVYRPAFSNRANKTLKGSEEDRRLRLEREIFSQFRTAGAAFLGSAEAIEAYFIAQHHGLPTRLLDWSTNPLAALFFACNGANDGANDKDGVVYAMDARKIISPDAELVAGRKLFQSVVTMRHDLVRYSVDLSCWRAEPGKFNPHILPVRPDIIPGRIGQQGSCFTLHMHEAKSITNSSSITLLIDRKVKAKIWDELHRLNVNQFTAFYDLDHLSSELKKRWGID